MEEWKEIKNYPQYQISSYGRVKSLKRKEEIILAPGLYSNGYQFVKLYLNGVKKYHLVHRLVLENFYPCEGMEKLQVNHIDCNRANNHLSNLEWSTALENRKYRDELKHIPKAETIEVEFLTGEKMVFDSMTQCANYFGITRKAVAKYLETNNIRKDRKVQAYFRKLGKTSELNN